jgi:hypothetical protein
MKKVVLFLFLFAIVTISYAQLVTPGTGVRWNRDSLVALGAFVPVGTYYSLSSSVVISAGDTVEITTNDSIVIIPGALITVNGVLNFDPPVSASITCNNPAQKFLGFRFDNSQGSVWKNVRVENAGGIKLVSSGVTFRECTFKSFDKSHSTGTIDCYQSSPVISGCQFIENAGPAVASGANAASSPQILGCYLYHNNTSNANTPQINLGPMATDSIRIIGNTIIGFYDMAGGVALSTLVGGQITARVDSNYIVNNRYGIACIGSNIGAVIRYNYLADNNIQGLPMQGGSGINLYGGSTNASMVSHNEITGNLWGITLQQNASPNLGQIEPDTVNIGWNKIYDNGNGGVTYNLYNNTPGNIKAENNFWGSYIPDTVEAGIFHQPDDGSLGLVDYLPLSPLITGDAGETVVDVESSVIQGMFPNPTSGLITLELQPGCVSDRHLADVAVFGLDGRLMFHQGLYVEKEPLTLDLGNLPDGIYYLTLTACGSRDVRLLNILR